MLTSRRIVPALALVAALAAVGVADRPARAGHKYRQQIPIYAAPAAAPAYVTQPAAAPAYYSTPSTAGSAPYYVYPTSTAGSAPAAAVATTTQAVAQAPAANVIYLNPGTTAASAPGSAPGAGGTLLAGAFRAALISDLKESYAKADSGTRLERINSLREDGRTAYAGYLHTDEDLTTEQSSDLDSIINDILGNDVNRSNLQNVYPPNAGAYPITPGYPYGANMVPVQYMYAPAPQPVALIPLVPVQFVPAHQHHLHPWKR